MQGAAVSQSNRMVIYITIIKNSCSTFHRPPTIPPTPRPQSDDVAELIARYRDVKGSTRPLMHQPWGPTPTRFDKLLASATQCLKAAHDANAKSAHRASRRLHDPIGELEGAVRAVGEWVERLRAEWGA